MTAADPTGQPEASAPRPFELAPDPDVPTPVAGPLPSPGPGWEAARTEGTGLEVWKRAVADPSEAAALWSARRAEHAATGWWPLLVDDGFWQSVELEPMPGGPAPLVDGRQWLSDRLFGADRLIDQLELGEVAPDSGETGAGADLLLGAAQNATAVVLVPAPASWLVPELVNWEGAVNHDMSGRQHTPVLRRWAGAYGAELVAMTLDVVTLRVADPPAGDDAVVAAFEAAAYCEDAVFQGTGTVGTLAAMTRQPLWMFWWD